MKAIADSTQPPTVLELAERTGLNRSTAWRLLATLDAHGLVERDPISQRYSVGYAILRIAASGEHDAIVRRARPVLEQLADDTGEAVNLGLAKGVHLVYVDQVDPPQILAPNWLGRHVPLHATSSGKAFMAYLDPAERDGLLGERLEPSRSRRSPTGDGSRRSSTTRAAPATRSAWASSRSRSTARRRAVLSEQGRPLAVVSVWGPERRVPAGRLPAIGELTRAAADEIRELLR